MQRADKNILLRSFLKVFLDAGLGTSWERLLYHSLLLHNFMAASQAVVFQWDFTKEMSRAQYNRKKLILHTCWV